MGGCPDKASGNPREVLDFHYAALMPDGLVIALLSGGAALIGVFVGQLLPRHWKKSDARLILRQDWSKTAMKEYREFLSRTPADRHSGRSWQPISPAPVELEILEPRAVSLMVSWMNERAQHGAAESDLYNKLADQLGFDERVLAASRLTSDIETETVEYLSRWARGAFGFDVTPFGTKRRLARERKAAALRRLARAKVVAVERLLETYGNETKEADSPRAEKRPIEG